jgi:hypothetical protein
VVAMKISLREERRMKGTWDVKRKKRAR